MRQNKDKLTLQIIAGLLYVVLSIVFMSTFFPSVTGEKMSIDAMQSYVPAIETGEITNWHSALYLIESRELKLFLDSIFNTDFNGTEIIYLEWWGFFCLILGSISCIILALSKKNILWAYALPFFSPLCPYFAYTLGWKGYYGLDFFFAALVLFGIALMLLYSKSTSKHIRILLLLAIIITMLHALSFRRNSICMVPFLIYWILNMHRQTKNWNQKCKILCCILVAITAYFVPNKLINSVCNVTTTYPIGPMLESDMRIASILRGKQNEWNNLGYSNLANPEVKETICASWNQKNDKISWSEFIDIYIRHWENDTPAMFASLAIQRIQFYCGGQNYPWLKNAIHSLFPEVKNNKRAWNIMAPHPIRKPRLRMILLSIPLFLLLILNTLYRKDIINESEKMILIILCVSSITYTLSYTIITPSVHTRYLAPSCLFSAFASGIVCVSFIIYFIRKKMIKAK